ncbi:MAG: HlyD family secretion protein [Desulfobacteraceae bacterium]
MKKSMILIGFIVLFLGAGLTVYLGQEEARVSELYYSGTIEATRAELAFQIGGRVARVLVDEGERVRPGQVLAELERAELTAAMDQARARVDTALGKLRGLEASLELQRKILPWEVKRAEAGVKALEANLKELQRGFRIQEIKSAEAALESAEETLEDARKDLDRYERLYRQGTVSEKEKDKASLRYQTALRSWESARYQHDLQKEGFREEDIEGAEARLEEGRAALELAKDNLGRIRVTEKEVEAARAGVKEARAALELARTRLGYASLAAPFEGTVTVRSVEPGEVVTASREVMAVTDLASVELRIFVGETEIGKVKPGQKVSIKVDTFPDRVFEGRVGFISPEAEFTPKYIQTHKERVKLVYLVKVIIPNPGRELKPGMPADAWLG